MESLEDLVDVAIDASERVVYDASAGWYVVIDGDVVYRYDGGSSAGDGTPEAAAGPESSSSIDANGPADDEGEDE